jgi:hypothetical protein
MAAEAEIENPDGIEYRLPVFLETQQRFREILQDGHPSGKNHILILFYIGGWGSGKTTIAKWTAFDYAVCFPGIRILIVRKTLASLELTTKLEFLEQMTEGDPEGRNMTDLLKAKWNEKKNVYTMVNGSQVVFGGLDNPAKWSSTQFGLIIIEECGESERRDLSYLRSRLRQKSPPCPECKGKACPECGNTGTLWGPEFSRALIGVGNHVYREHWIYADFIGTPETPRRPNHVLVETSSWENHPDKGGYLPEGYLESIVEQEDEQTVSVFVAGSWGVMPRGTPVFPFVANMRGVPWHENPELKFDASIPLYWSFDFGYRFPFITFHQIGPRGQWRILAEYTLAKSHTTSLMTAVLPFAAERFPSWWAPWCCGDPAGWADRSEGPNDAETIQKKLGLPFRSIPSTEQTKIARRKVVRARLETALAGYPSFVINPEACPVLREALSGLYHYPEVREPTASGGTNYRETPVERHPYVDVAHTIEYFAACMWQEEIRRSGRRTFRSFTPVYNT